MTSRKRGRSDLAIYILRVNLVTNSIIQIKGVDHRLSHFDAVVCGLLFECISTKATPTRHTSLDS